MFASWANVSNSAFKLSSSSVILPDIMVLCPLGVYIAIPRRRPPNNQFFLNGQPQGRLWRICCWQEDTHKKRLPSFSSAHKAKSKTKIRFLSNGRMQGILKKKEATRSTVLVFFKKISPTVRLCPQPGAVLSMAGQQQNRKSEKQLRVCVDRVPRNPPIGPARAGISSKQQINYSLFYTPSAIGWSIETTGMWCLHNHSPASLRISLSFRPFPPKSFEFAGAELDTAVQPAHHNLFISFFFWLLQLLHEKTRRRASLRRGSSNGQASDFCSTHITSEGNYTYCCWTTERFSCQVCNRVVVQTGFVLIAGITLFEWK